MNASATPVANGADRAAASIDESPLSLSLIVPVGPGDRSWRGLRAYLAHLPDSVEVLFVGCEPAPADWPPSERHTARWIQAPRGRAAQCNAGAAQSQGAFLWWLHADSTPEPIAYQALIQSVQDHPQALHWFRLRFADGPRLAALNAAGANWRSRRFGLPFGDQGLCISRRWYQRLGGFDETLALGEDLSLVLRARRAGITLQEVPAQIATSGRRYSQQGWLRTTLRHWWLTWRLSRAERARHVN